MTSLFSVVSGQFTRYLITGTLLPVFLFLGIGFAFAFPLIPGGPGAASALKSLDTEWLLAFSLAVLLVTALLYNLNTPLIRLYEGYPWRRSWIGQWCVRQRQRELDELITLRIQLRKIGQLLRAASSNDPRADLLGDRQRQIAQRLSVGFPGRDLVLPTRLGNTIRSFEEYSRIQYGMDAVFLWSRLIGKASKEYLATIEESKTSFDFFLNSSLLSSMLAIALLIVGLSFKRPFATDLRLTLWVLEITGLIFVTALAYRLAIGSAASWGAQVKGAFDLYRFDLLSQFGYRQKPVSRTEERELWAEISRQIYYGDPPFRAPRPYSDPRFSVKTVPPEIPFTVVEGVGQSSKGGARLFCRIVNHQKTTASEASLILALEDGQSFVWSSAKIADAAGEVAVSPLRQLSFGRLEFPIPSLRAGESVVFSCRLTESKKSQASSSGGQRE